MTNARYVQEDNFNNFEKIISEIIEIIKKKSATRNKRN